LSPTAANTVAITPSMFPSSFDVVGALPARATAKLRPAQAGRKISANWAT